MTLTEPLLPTGARATFEDDFADLCLTAPKFVARFAGGVVSDLVLTLPERDPWRNLSWRLGERTGGELPGASDGALRPDGAPFGTWQDAADLIQPLFADPDVDPGLVALSAGLSAPAAALLASGASGHQVARDVALAVAERTAPAPDQDVAESLVVPDRFAVAWAANELRTAAVDAIRWLVHRRRAYLGEIDAWPTESVFRWAWRADREVGGFDWDGSDIARGIESETVAQLAPQDRPDADDDLDDLF